MWHGSEAEKQLKSDIESGVHATMKPKELWLSSQVYKQFDLTPFRAHIYQEIRSTKETQYWIVKKMKKAARKANAKDGNEDGQKFFIDEAINTDAGRI